MYLRTTSRKNRDGTVVEYYQLAHNVRDPVTRKPVAHVIHKFGRADQLDRNELVRLCRSIARVCNIEVIDRLDTNEPFGVASGFPESFVQRHTYPYGPTLAIEALWEQLGIGDCLRGLCKRLNYRVPYERAIFTMVANRLCQPESKLGVWDRWLPTAYLPSCWDLKLAQMYEALDMLFEHSEEVERQRKRREEAVRYLEEELARHPRPDATAQWAIDLLASLRFKRYLRVTKSHKIWIDRGAIREAAKYDGKWVLETDDDTLRLEDAAEGYKGLMVIERCFRSLKRTHIKVSPLYHWFPRRIEANVKIYVLALLIERMAEHRCGKPWSRIKGALDELQISNFSVDAYQLYLRNEITVRTRSTLKSLGIEPPPLVDRLESDSETSQNL
jgi:hypothetical protein